MKTMKEKYRFIFPALAALLAVSSAPAATLYSLGGTVLDGSPGENTYIARGNTGTSGLSYNGGAPSLTWTGGTVANPTSYVVGYFSSFNLVNLGDSITLSYSIAAGSASAFSTGDQSFRVGLFNSGGSLISANIAGTGDAALNSYGGYDATYRPNGTSTGSDRFYQRTVASNNLMTSAAFTAAGTGITLDSPGTGSFTGSLKLELVATGLQITSVINGGPAQSVIDTTGIVTGFDAFSFQSTVGVANPTFTFSDLTVSAVPEPSTYALLLCGAGVLALLRTRSKRKTE